MKKYRIFALVIASFMIGSMVSCGNDAGSQSEKRVNLKSNHQT